MKFYISRIAKAEAEQEEILRLIEEARGPINWANPRPDDAVWAALELRMACAIGQMRDRRRARWLLAITALLLGAASTVTILLFSGFFSGG